jgi:hypothetical protein
VWCLLSSCKTERTLWAQLGGDKVDGHYRGDVRASVLRRMDRQPAPEASVLLSCDSCQGEKMTVALEDIS